MQVSFLIYYLPSNKARPYFVVPFSTKHTENKMYTSHLKMLFISLSNKLSHTHKNGISAVIKMML